MKDVTYGGVKNMRGQWMDRLPAIDADIDLMRGVALKPPTSNSGISEEVKQAVIQQVMSPTARPLVSCQHTPAATFHAGSAVPIEIRVGPGAGILRLKYRHVNQAEYYETIEMTGNNGRYRATIPADYTRSEYALQYYFELQHSPR